MVYELSHNKKDATLFKIQCISTDNSFPTAFNLSYYSGLALLP